MSSERLEEYRDIIHKMIEKHIDEIDSNNFGIIYDDMWEQEVPMEYISTLTEQFWEAGIEPLEHMNYVPECYAAFLIDVPERMIIPGNCLDISANAYCYCYMQDIVLQEGVGSIRERAFSNCDNLTSIYLPSTIKYIHHLAFRASTNINYIKYNGKIEQFHKIRTSIQKNLVDILEESVNYNPLKIECLDGTISLGQY